MYLQRKPRVGDEQLLNELQEFYRLHGRSSSMKENPWLFSLKADRIAKRFGSWNNALATAKVPIYEAKYVNDE